MYQSLLDIILFYLLIKISDVYYNIYTVKDIRCRNKKRRNFVYIMTYYNYLSCNLKFKRQCEREREKYVLACEKYLLIHRERIFIIIMYEIYLRIFILHDEIYHPVLE